MVKLCASVVPIPDTVSYFLPAWQEHGRCLRRSGLVSQELGQRHGKNVSIHDPPFHLFSRKLKNRVAAQTARDRKKAKMGELEQQVLELELEVMKYSSY